MSKNGNLYWVIDEHLDLTEYAYEYHHDTLIKKQFVNHVLQELNTRYVLNKKNKPVLCFYYSDNLLQMYFRYTYKDDTIPVLIEEVSNDSVITGVKRFEYDKKTIIAKTFRHDDLIGIDSIFLDSNNFLSKIVTYEKNIENILAFWQLSKYSYGRMDDEGELFIKNNDIQLYERLSKRR